MRLAARSLALAGQRWQHRGSDPAGSRRSGPDRARSRPAVGAAVSEARLDAAAGGGGGGDQVLVSTRHRHHRFAARGRRITVRPDDAEHAAIELAAGREERLTVGVQRLPSKAVRMKKRIVTEKVSQTVPVTTERATVAREPITDANRAKAMDGPEITEAVHEVTLHTERPVVAKETVPVERVRLAKDVVTEQQTVTEEVRKEQIEVDDETGPTNRKR